MTIYDILKNEFGNRNFDNILSPLLDTEVDSIEYRPYNDNNYYIINGNSDNAVVIQITNKSSYAGYRLAKYTPYYETELPLTPWDDFWLFD